MPDAANRIAERIAYLPDMLMEHQVAMIADVLREEVKGLVEAARLKRIAIIRDEKGFVGDWVAIPEEDYHKLRDALRAFEDATK